MKRGALVVISAWAAGLPLGAHDPGLSSVEVKLEAASVVACVTFAGSDAAALPALPARALEVELDGRPATAAAASMGRDAGNVQVKLVFAGAPRARIALRSPLLGSLPFGHRQYVAVRAAGGRVLGEAMLSGRANGLELAVGATGEARRFREFLALGLEHIGRGYDHIVFLLGLLLAGGCFRSTLKIITSFTAAHSITLALATLGLVTLPPRVVEPLIAASIVYVGLENIFRRDLERRWMLTFAFGLAHGFGFASALRDLGIGSGGAGVALPLVSFNLGVELGQIAIALLVLPLVWQLRRHPSFVARWVPACSVLVAAAGGFWLIERVLL